MTDDFADLVMEQEMRPRPRYRRLRWPSWGALLNLFHERPEVRGIHTPDNMEIPEAIRRRAEVAKALLANTVLAEAHNAACFVTDIRAGILRHLLPFTIRS